MSLKSISKPKVKKKVVRAKAGALVAQIKLGGEPVLYNPSQSELIRAFNWYASCAHPDKRVIWLQEYMIKHGWNNEALAKVARKGRNVIPTFAYIARMLNNGCLLADTVAIQLRRYINELAASATGGFEVDEDGNLIASEPVAAVKASRTPRSEFQTNRMVEFIDQQMDLVLAGKTANKSVYEQLVNMGCSVVHAKALREFYKPQAEEFAELRAGKDEQLNEGYAHLNRKTRIAISEWLAQLLVDLQSFLQAKKVVRKPRKARPVSTDKLVKRLRYMKESTEFKIASFDPVKLVGATVFYTFNTKYRLLQRYTATAAGFTVKGTTLMNIADGQQKKLRHPESVLPELLAASKTTAGTRFTGISTKPSKANGRINEHNILLKVY